MNEELIFQGWARSAAAAQATEIQGGRLVGKLTLTATSSTGATLPGTDIAFELHGPPDVRLLQPGAIRRRYPAPGAANVDPDYCAYVEFNAPDLPWRYSLQAIPGAPDALQPWLVLVVGTTEEISLLPGGQAELRGQVKLEHDLSKSARWAHLQRDPAGQETVRLLSPRRLGERQATWLALLVPTYRNDGTLRWGNDPTPVTVPVYSWWTFQTAENQGFVALARRLQPERPGPGLGYAPLAYQAGLAVELAPQLVAAGALISPLLAGDPDPRRAALPPEIKDHFLNLLAGGDLPRDDQVGRPVDEAGRPVVMLPVYGEPWFIASVPQPQWATELSSDPRLRGLAGLGAWAAIEWQEKIVEAATKQAGALAIAAQRLRQLTLGLEATRRLWNRRLLPASPEERLTIIGPALARMETIQGGSLLEHVSAAGRPLPPALFSSAARRVLRPRGPLGRRAAEGAMQPARWLPALNNCDQFSAPQLTVQGLAHVELIGVSNLEQRIGEFIDAFGFDNDAYAEHFRFPDEILEAMEWMQEEENAELEAAGARMAEFAGDMLREGLFDGGSARHIFKEAFITEPDRACQARRVNLEALGERLVEALDPHAPLPFVVERVLKTIQGLDDQPLTPPELCLDFQIPAWQFLRDYAKNWMLPGIERIVVFQHDAAGQLVLDEAGEAVPDPNKDPVVAVSTNALFTDAFMVGFNQQALQELRWLNIPVQTGCTPLRRFWEPVGVRPQNPPHPRAGQLDTLEDINGIHRWDDTPLGDASHETANVRGDNLVLVFKTELFRRYPNTLVYLVPRLADDLDWSNKPAWAGARLEPNLQAIVDKDAVLFGFARGPEVLADHWLVVEQVPQGYNFYNHPDTLPTLQRKTEYAESADGGSFAKAAFVNPVRLIIQGPLMLPEEE